jgi:N-acylneuraminate cytidylyltransferase
VRIALIPCRTGSKRIPNKNFKELGGKPLWRWTWEAAVESDCFDEYAFCTNNPLQFGEMCVPVLEQVHPLHSDTCRDIDWLSDALKRLYARPDDEICILRPTSPFRDEAVIRRAFDQWDTLKHDYDSMRAIRKCSEHPMKQWQYDPDSHELWAWMKASHHQHLHSRPTQELADSYVQTAGIEIAWAKCALEKGTIAGDRIAGFFLEGPAALDLNTPDDWDRAEAFLKSQSCHYPSG